jgi:signal transduction histidine kinase
MTATHHEASTSSGETRVMLEHAPVPIWLEDWSGVARLCDELRADGVVDARARLLEDESLRRSAVDRVVVLDVNARAVDFAGASHASQLVGGTSVALLLSNGSHDAIVDQLMTVYNGVGEITCDVGGVNMKGVDVECQVHWAAPRIDGRPDYSNVMVMVHDTRAQKVAEREMYKLIEDVDVHLDAERRIHEHVRRLEALIDMSRSLAATFDRDALLRLVVTITQKVIGAEQAAIHLLDVEESEVVAVASSGIPQEVVVGCTHAEGMDGLCGWLVANRQATTVANLADDDRLRNHDGQCASIYQDGAAAAGAPIVLDDEVVGTLVAINPDGREFNEMDLSLVRMTAAQTAVGLRNSQLLGKVRRSRDEAQLAHRELKEAQTQLLQAQKLESIGSLAAGIAHEINTPIQFISDNATFVEGAIGPLNEAVRAGAEFLKRAADHPELANHAASVIELWNKNDCSYLLEEIPVALSETLEGAGRVAEIVRAMKDFAHPGSEDKHLSDINRVVRTTVEISRNEWKYVADLELDLAEELPEIPAHAGPLGQALLIMIVNSAQALGEQGAGHEEAKGKIRVSTSLQPGHIEIRVADTGPGIPSEVVDRIFDPFFTTKEVGKGSGQGLSIAHSIVVDKHGGHIVVEDGNPGAVFVITLPIPEQSR